MKANGKVRKRNLFLCALVLLLLSACDPDAAAVPTPDAEQSVLPSVANTPEPTPEPTVTPSSEPSSDPAGLPWEVPAAENTPSYEDYFAQVIDYHYPDPDGGAEPWLISAGYNIDPYVLTYEGPDLYIASGNGELLLKITDMPGLDVFCCDRSWIYAVVNGKELIRMNFFGEIETLFTDEAGLIKVNCLADGKVLYFWAGLPEGGAAIYRLYIPDGRADVLYQITQEELEQYYYEPPADGGETEFSRASAGYLMSAVEPVSNFEFTWVTGNREFCELYDSLVLHAGDHPQYFDQGLEGVEIKFRIEVDYGIREYTDHYYNARTGEHLTRQQSGYSNPVYPWWKE